MKVRCIADCFYQGREFRTNDIKYHGIYNIEVKPGDKLPPHLVPVEAPKPAPPVKPKAKSAVDDVFS